MLINSLQCLRLKERRFDTPQNCGHSVYQKRGPVRAVLQGAAPPLCHRTVARRNGDGRWRFTSTASMLRSLMIPLSTRLTRPAWPRRTLEYTAARAAATKLASPRDIRCLRRVSTRTLAQQKPNGVLPFTPNTRIDHRRLGHVASRMRPMPSPRELVYRPRSRARSRVRIIGLCAPSLSDASDWVVELESGCVATRRLECSACCRL